MSQTSLRFVRLVLNSLKRAYRGEIIINRRCSVEVNVATGVKDVCVDTWKVNKAIILPKTIQREFAYDLAYIAVLKEFTYGAQFDTGIRRIIVDNRDMPAGWKPLKDDYIIYDGIRYEIRQIQEFEFKAGFIYELKALEGNDPNYAIPVCWRSTLHLTDGVEYDQS